MANRLSVNVEVPKALLEGAAGIERQESRLMRRLAEKTRDELAAKAPGAAGGKIGRSFVAESGAHEAQAVSRHPGARALDRGAYITPRGLRKLSREQLLRQPRRLKFEAGGRTIFAPAVRIRPRHYVAKVVRSRRRLIDSAFRETIGTRP